MNAMTRLLKSECLRNENRPFDASAEKGFTLIELLLYVGIASVLFLTISLFLFTLLQSRVKNQTIAEVNQQGIQVLQAITQRVRSADSIKDLYPGGTDVRLSVYTSDPATSPTRFDVEQGVLRITEGSGPAIALTNSRVTVSNLLFSNLTPNGAPGSISIAFTLSYTNQDERNEFSFSKVFHAGASLRRP
jgi:Tfp pilus assembly protein PilW